MNESFYASVNTMVKVFKMERNSDTVRPTYRIWSVKKLKGIHFPTDFIFVVRGSEGGIR